jgi:Fe-S-cluster containining protein
MRGCKMCGECCKWVYITAVGPMSILTEIDHLRGIEQVEKNRVRIPCPCRHLDIETHKCQIWHSRPGVCRLYPDRTDTNKYPIIKECRYED